MTASHFGLAGLILPSLFLFLTFQKLPQFPDLTRVGKELCFLIFLIFFLKEGSYTNKNVMHRSWLTRRALASWPTRESSGLYSGAFPHFNKCHPRPTASFWFSFTPKVLEKAFFKSVFSMNIHLPIHLLIKYITESSLSVK